MNKTLDEAQDYFQAIQKEEVDHDQVEAVVAAPDLFLVEAVQAFDGTGYKVGAQNCYPAEEGAYTGETSVKALADLGVDFVILGHSERRSIFKESDDFINAKVKAVFDQGMTPILCVGESLEEKEEGKTQAVITRQIEKGLAGVDSQDIPHLVVGYEPVWAIGTGKTATAEEAQEACQAIRQKIADLYSKELADRVRIQYGGSAKPDNIGQFVSQDDIDGGLIGGAGLEVASFVDMLKVASDHA